VASDGSGHLFVADSGNFTIRKIDLASGAVTTIAGSPGSSGTTDGTGNAARFLTPLGLALDQEGNLFVADANTIRRVVVATGAVTTIAGSPETWGSTDGTGSAARFSGPAGMAVDGSGNLFVADTNNHTIRKVVIATASVTTLAGSARNNGNADGTGAAARFWGPWGVASDGSGNLFVVDSANSTIRKVVIATGAVTTLAGSAGNLGSTDGMGSAARFNLPRGVASDRAGNLFVADYYSYAIRKIVIATQEVTTVVGSPRRMGVLPGSLPAGLSCPAELTIVPSGELLIADECENAILAAWF
jgi:hypothetical protein